MPISVSQAQKVCGKEPLSTFLPAFSCNAQNAISSSKVSHWRFPDCSLRDKILHLFFVFCVLIMIACAAVTIICFKEVNKDSSTDRANTAKTRYSSYYCIDHTEQYRYTQLSTRTMQDRWSHRKRPSGIRVPGLDLTPINPNQFIKPISAMAAATVDSLEVKASQNAIERILR